MSKRIIAFASAFFLLLQLSSAAGSEINLRDRWMIYDGEKYVAFDSSSHGALTTIYILIDGADHIAATLSVRSSANFFLFINGKVAGEYSGYAALDVDSLINMHYSPLLLVGIHQTKINERDLKVSIVSAKSAAAAIESLEKPETWFRDFVTAAGLILIVLFLVISRLNPKLASDYFSVTKIFSLREADDIQSTARLTSSTNIQFYTCCSLLLGYYMLILFRHLPGDFALPTRFPVRSFGSCLVQWVRLSAIILIFFITKITIIFSLTRLFSMRGMARLHFFNWVRLMLIVVGVSSVIVFLYFINHGRQTAFFVAFLSVIAATSIGWVLLAFMKLNGKSEHSLFHLFSYICATEIIPLLITVKVLYQ